MADSMGQMNGELGPGAVPSPVESPAARFPAVPGSVRAEDMGQQQQMGGGVQQHPPAQNQQHQQAPAGPEWLRYHDQVVNEARRLNDEIQPYRKLQNQLATIPGGMEKFNEALEYTFGDKPLPSSAPSAAPPPAAGPPSQGAPPPVQVQLPQDLVDVMRENARQTAQNNAYQREQVEARQLEQTNAKLSQKMQEIEAINGPVDRYAIFNIAQHYMDPTNPQRKLVSDVNDLPKAVAVWQQMSGRVPQQQQRQQAPPQQYQQAPQQYQQYTPPPAQQYQTNTVVPPPTRGAVPPSQMAPQQYNPQDRASLRAAALAELNRYR